MISVTLTFLDDHSWGVVLYCSALSVMGTWYVTIVIIVKYIWPDKEVTPGYNPDRWVLHTLTASQNDLNV